MTDRQALLSAAGKQRPYKAVNIKPPAMPGDIYFLYTFASNVLCTRNKSAVFARVHKNDTLDSVDTQNFIK